MRDPTVNSSIGLRSALLLGLSMTASGYLCAQIAPHQDFVCVSSGSKRIVSVFNLDTRDGQQKYAGCRVDYTKDGATKTLYSSRSGRAYCAAKAAQLVTNLEKGNYSCRLEMVEKSDDVDLPSTRPPASN